MSDVTITLNREDADWIRAMVDRPDQWVEQQTVQRIKQTLAAAAPRPAEAADTPHSDRSRYDGEPNPAIGTAADSMTVRIDAGGAAHLLAVDDDGGCGITVPKEKRQAVALALLGPVDEAMIKSIESAVRRATWLRPEPGDVARAVIAALFGEPA